MRLDNNQFAFFAMVKAGLWEQEARLSQYGELDFSKIYQLAEEQAVVGLVSAGIEHVVDVKIPQEIVLQFVGATIQIEHRNAAMNKFIVAIMSQLKEAGVDSALIKGQGVAQCYERPMWRSCGDVDLLLNDVNYEKGKRFIGKISESGSKEYGFNKEYQTTIGGWTLELHGSLRSGLSTAFNKGVDEIQRDICDNHNVRYWEVEGDKIPLPEENDDVLVIFTHFIKHFYKGELGIRQICDWCRLLYTYRDTLNYGLLESRIRKMGLMSEWKAFYNLASRYLGMPDLDSRLMIQDSRFDKKADRIMGLVLESGNFGHNKDLSYRSRFSGLTYKIVAVWRRFLDFCRFAAIFPLDAPLFFVTYVMGKVK